MADQTGKIFNPNTLTIVWARRFAGYKRADLLLYDIERFNKLMTNEKYPVQIIWAGKPYPHDYSAIGTFNHLIDEGGNKVVLNSAEELWNLLVKINPSLEK